MAPVSTTLTTKVDSGSPYQLSQPQVLKASTALLSHIKNTASSSAASAEKKSLLAVSSTSSTPTPDDNEPIWLVFTTKTHITPKKRLKPGKIPLPHPLNTSTEASILLITADPQRTFKDMVAHPSFPAGLGKRITRVIGVSKLKAKYKSFESKRQLRDEYDIVLADDRVITMLPPLLGKTFYGGGSKRPIPVSLEPYTPRKDASSKPNPFSVVKAKPTKDDGQAVAPPPQCAKAIERALDCALIHLSPSATTSVRVGFSTFTPAQISKNIEAVVNGMVEKFVAKGWRNVKAIHIKGPKTMALPIWLAEELWVDDSHVLEADQAEEAKKLASQKGRKRKGRELIKVTEEQLKIEGPKDASGKKRKLEDADFGAEMKERREKLRKQKAEIRNSDDGLSRRAKAGEEGKVKVKRRKRVTVTEGIVTEG